MDELIDFGHNTKKDDDIDLTLAKKYNISQGEINAIVDGYKKPPVEIYIDQPSIINSDINKFPVLKDDDEEFFLKCFDNLMKYAMNKNESLFEVISGYKDFNLKAYDMLSLNIILDNSSCDTVNIEYFDVENDAVVLKTKSIIVDFI